jgi:hypothetical protein
MAEKTALPKSLYAFGEGEESAEANRRYEDAYNQLIAAVEKRNQPQFFDPTLLAISQAFLGPTKTGGFGEAAGVAAGNVAKSQEAQQTREEELAKMRLELAGMGVERARQQWIARGYQDLGPVAEQKAGPQAGAKTPAATQAGAEEAPMREEGIQVSTSPKINIGVSNPVDEAAIKRKYLAAGKPIDDAKLEIEAEKLKRIVQKDNYIYNGNTGEVTILPTGSLAEVNIPGKGIYKVPMGVKQVLEAAEFNDPKQYWKIVNQVISGPTQVESASVPKPEFQVRPYSIEAQEAAVPSAPPAAPSAAPPVSRPVPQPAAQPPAQPPAPVQRPAVASAAPSFVSATPPAGRLSQEQAAEREAQLKQQRDLELERAKARIAAVEGAEAKRQETIGAERGKLAVAEETKFGLNAENAGKLYTAADTVVNAVKNSPNYFGIFNKPGVLNAIGSSLAELSNPNGKFKIVDFESQVVKLMPGTTPENILDRQKAASALAEIELGYTQTYLAKQGAVTEGERKIVRDIPGGLSSSPKFLELKGKLIRERAQYDMDVNLAYSEYLRAKPNGDALDFKRNSPLYKEIHSAFEKKTAELAGTIPSLPTKERQTPAKSNDASSYVEGLLKRRGQQ